MRRGSFQRLGLFISKIFLFINVGSNIAEHHLQVFYDRYIVLLRSFTVKGHALRTVSSNEASRTRAQGGLKPYGRLGFKLLMLNPNLPKTQIPYVWGGGGAGWLI